MKLSVDVARDGDGVHVRISDDADYRPEVLRDWCARALEVVHAQYQLQQEDV
jgi:hypothetical protein